MIPHASNQPNGATLVVDPTIRVPPGQRSLATFDRLSALDAVFLAIESDRNPMHIGLTAVFEKGPLRTPEGGLDRNRIRTYARTVLASVPKFRRKIAPIPLIRRPVLVDDDHFDLDHHLRFVSLSRNDDGELEALVGRLYSRRIDRTRPLWELWFVDGLSGDRFAVVSKAHHCMVDGVSGIAAFTAMLRPTPDSTFAEPAEWRPVTPPTPLALLGDELKRWLDRARNAARPSLGDIPEKARHFVTGLSHALAMALPPASRTSLNPARVGERRSVAFCELDLRTVKAVKSAASVRLNDVVLATIAGALRRFIARRGEAVGDLEFRALVPVSTHATNAGPTLDNEVSALIVTLPLAEANGKRRLEAVSRRMSEAKASGTIEAIDLMERLADVFSFSLVTFVVRVGIHVRPYNVIVTNVPGPGFPLYFLGARLLKAYPMVPLYGNNALGVAVLSYDNQLCWGLSADPDRAPELSRLCDDLRDEFRELEAGVLHS